MCLQVQYSLLSCGPAQEEVRASCRDLGIQMIAYSPLALGMLVGECTACLKGPFLCTPPLRWACLWASARLALWCRQRSAHAT